MKPLLQDFVIDEETENENSEMAEKVHPGDSDTASKTEQGETMDEQEIKVMQEKTKYETPKTTKQTEPKKEERSVLFRAFEPERERDRLEERQDSKRDMRARVKASQSRKN